MPRALALALAVAVTAFFTACQSEGADAPTAQPRAETSADGNAATPADRALIRSFAAFARSPTESRWSELRLARTVQLGLGRRLVLKRSARELRDPEAWKIHARLFRAAVGPFSALRLLADERRAFAVSVGPHRHCVSPPVPPPRAVRSLRRISVQPQTADCLSWWSVDLYVTDDGEVSAVTLDHWEP